MRHLRWLGPAGALVTALLLVAPLAASPEAIPGGNLVKNPGAEESAGTIFDIVVAPAGWMTTGALSAWTYGALGDRPDKAFARSIGGGETFFSGGPGGIPGQPTASQSVDVSGAATEIDANGVSATLKAFIGGYTVSEDLLRIDALFLDSSGARLGGVHIGPVNREDRKRVTTLLERSTTGNVPRNTRRIDVVISVAVDNNGKNQAYADNISLTLGKASTTPGATKTATLGVKCSAKTVVATLKAAAGQKVKRVAFSTSGRKTADTKAPFTARFPTKGLPAQVVVRAQVTSDGPVQNLSKSVKRC